MCVYIYIYTHIEVYMYVHVFVFKDKHKYKHTKSKSITTCTYIHTYIHTYMHAYRLCACLNCCIRPHFPEPDARQTTERQGMEGHLSLLHGNLGRNFLKICGHGLRPHVPPYPEYASAVRWQQDSVCVGSILHRAFHAKAYRHIGRDSMPKCRGRAVLK